MLCGIRRETDPKSSNEVEDHNLSVGLLRDLDRYLENRKNKARRFFNKVLRHSEVTDLIKEMEEVRHKWRENRSSDRKWFNRMKEMESIAFAETKIGEIWPDSSDHSSGHRKTVIR